MSYFLTFFICDKQRTLKPETDRSAERSATALAGLAVHVIKIHTLENDKLVPGVKLLVLLPSCWRAKCVK